MTNLHRNTAVLMKRAEGRLFTENGNLFLVLDVDCEEETARVSARIDGSHQVLTMPLADLSERLSIDAEPKLDGVAETTQSGRLRLASDGWYYKSRSGEQGPFPTKDEADAALKRYIVEIQGQPRADQPRADQPSAT
ncbi:MAG: hypothetical protein AAGG11_04965 [Pseudomonadota bacterium]